MLTWRFWLSLMIVVAVGSVAAQGLRAATGINQQISFQGKVVNSTGTNVANGNYDFVFKLYTVSSGGAAVWTETWNSGTAQVTVTDGVFQVNLGTHTALPGSIDFNTDNIYLGVEFNGDGEMSPRVHFTAAPYAFNAKKVAGLTVTDTTGTLTIPNSKTISFADAFATSGAFSTTLTATGVTNVTLPTTGTLATLAGSESLTNKTIGSTGLTFSGASTDITTATDESLTLVANGTGTIVLNDSVTSGALTISGVATDISTDSNEDLTVVANGSGTINLNDTVTVGSTLTLSSVTGTTQCLHVNTSGVVSGSGSDCGSGSNSWDTIGDPSGNGSVAMAETVQTLDWNTNNVTSLAFDGLTVTITNDAATDILTQRAFVVANADDSGTTGTTETITQVVNRDANETVGTGLLVENTGTGTMTNAIQIAETAGTITDGILITGTLGNILNSGSIDITGAGAITGATGITSATGDITATAGNVAITAGVLTLNSVTRISNAGVGTFITGTVIGSQTFTTNNIADSGALTIASGSATALTLNSGTTGTINIGTDASAETINIGNTGAAVKTIAIGNNTQANTITIGDASVTGLSLTEDNWSVSSAGAAAFASMSSAGAIAANGESITFDGATLVINGGGAVDIQDSLNADSITSDAGVSIAAAQSYTGSGAVTLASAAASDLTINSGTTGGINIGTDTSAETISIGTGVAAKTITIGNSTDDTFSINSSGLNVTSGGALTGVASIDTISVSATAITFAGSGTLASTTTGLTLDSGSNTLTVAASDTIITASGVTTLTLGTNTNIASAGTITIDATSTTIIPDADTFQTNDVTSTGALTLSAGSTAQNITLTPTTTGYVSVASSTGTSDTIRLLPATGAAAFAGIITTADLTVSDKTYTFPDATITVNAAADISGTTLASNVVTSSLTTVGTLGSLTVSGAIAANGGITFDASTDTVGAFTAAGTIDMSTNILTNIGNTGTDFVASTGALTLAGVLTANGGVTLAASQTFTASSLSYMDLGAITHGSTAVQGLRLPQAASASPSSPTSGEGYLAWDAGGNQVIYYNGSAWATFSAGSGYATIKDEASSLTARTTLAFLGAGVSCADNVTQTECTISGGAGSDLQGTYDTDADGSNATISLTAADDGIIFTNPTSGGNDLSTFLLQLDQANTTANVKALDIVQSSNAANAVNITANSIDGETGLAITTNGLTSGNGISVASSSTGMTGNLAQVALSGSDAANTGDILELSNTGTANANTTLHIDHRASGTGNLALRVDDESSDATPFIVDGDGRVGIGTSSISAAAATERLLQVGSETNRGNTAVYGEVISKGQRDITGLTGIKDIFVYDTSADSDGGRWIDWATTDKLSWYTESLDDSASDPCVIATDDRCYKASFPRKAILIVTSDSLYIFDSQDNTLWMKFSQNASGYALGLDTNNDPSSVTALNGVVYVGTNGSAAGGLYVFDFVNDRMYNYDATDRSGADVGIGSRNSAVTYNSDNNTAFDLGTVGTVADWARINDVSATVIQTSTTQVASTVNPRNGIVMIGLATDSGLSLINLNDQKILQYSDATDNDYNSVVITRTAKLYGLNETLGQAEMWTDVDDDKASEVNGTPTKVLDEVSTPPITKSAPTIGVAPDALEVVERASMADAGVLATAAIASSSDLVYIGTNQGLSEVHLWQTSASNWNGWSKLTDTTRQTPLMVNSVKAMIPFDDASGNVTDAIKSNIFEPKGSPTYGVNGVRGKAMSFNGTSQYLCADGAVDDTTCEVDADLNLSTTGFTITGWFKHSATAPVTTPDVVFARCYTTTPSAATGCLALWMNTTGTMTVGIDDDATWTIGTGSAFDANAATTQTYNDNQWHFFSLSRTNAQTLAYFSVDGKLATLTTTAAPTLTLDGSQILGIGTDCSSGAACSTGGNLWDGSLDDFTWSSGGASTTDTTNTIQSRRLYNDARPTVGKKTITVTDATTATSTTIGDSGEAWIPNEFAGMIVELTGGTGSGQTRRIVGNTATVMTVSPAFTSTPDTTTDFQVQPEKLYGASNTVMAIGVTGETPLGEAKMLCVGTNSATDTGGVTCFNHQAGPNIVADVFHADAKQVDDSSTEWTGTDYDDIQSIDFSGRALVIGSMAHFWTETQDVRLGQGLDYLNNKIINAQNQILNLGLQTLAGSAGVEVGLTGGADLAEQYYSNETLQAGEVVAMDASLEAGVKKTTSRYQRDVLGIVATTPGIILGSEAENGYPIALVGRVPVKVTNENGPIYAGDRLTAASRPGFAMRATQAGRVIGQAISDASDWAVCEGENPADVNAFLCTTVMVFVNLADYYGQSVEFAMTDRDTRAADAALDPVVGDEGVGLTGTNASVRLAQSEPTREEKIMSFLKTVRDERTNLGSAPSEVFTDRVAASSEVITPKLVADEIFAKSIKADSIEGLAIWTDRIASLQEKYAGLEPATANDQGDTQVKSSVMNLEKFGVGSLAVALDASVLGKLSVGGALSIADAAEFQGKTTFARLATFLDETLFKGRVAFEQPPVFSADTAGFATIEKGRKKVRVTFAEAYRKQPVVTVALTREVSPLINDDADEDLRADVAAVDKDFAENIFDANIRYIVTEKDRTGFTILLSNDAPSDLTFSWLAIAVDQPKTSVSSPEKQPKSESVEESPSPSPDVPVVETPTPAPETLPIPESIQLLPEESSSSVEVAPTSTDGDAI